MIVATLVRLPTLWHPTYPDEGGLLIVAARWHDDGPGLYGWLFVDRPPGLLLFFWLAHALGGVLALRLLGLLLVTVSVAASGRIGWLLGRRAGTITASLVSALLLSSPVLGAQEVNAELVGLPLVLGGVALALAAMRAHGRRAVTLMVLAGLAVGAAPLVKQNLIDGIAFVAVLVLLQARLRHWGWRRLTGTAGLMLATAAVPWLVTAAWLVWDGPGLRPAWDAVVDFRFRAGEVIAATYSPRNQSRMLWLPVRAVVSGQAVLLAVAAWVVRHRRRDPVVVAGAALLAAEVPGVVLGGSYWPHYLLALVPSTVTFCALAAGEPRLSTPWLKLAVAGTVGATLVSGLLTWGPIGVGQAHGDDLASWLREAKRPGDRGVVTYGQAQVLETSGLRPAYPYLWSLPVRTLDPRLLTLAGRLESSHRPEWVIVDAPVDTWGLDATGRVSRALGRYYRPVGVVCGAVVFLRVGAHRTLPPLPRDCTG